MASSTWDKEFAIEMQPHIAFASWHYLENLDENGLLSMHGWNMLDWAPMDQPNRGIVTHQNAFFVKALDHPSQIEHQPRSAIRIALGKSPLQRILAFLSLGGHIFVSLYDNILEHNFPTWNGEDEEFWFDI